VFIPEKGSACDLWRNYYVQLKREVGKVNARALWLMTWDEFGNMSCATNPEFEKWLQRNKLDITNASTRAMAGMNAIGSNMLGLGKGVTKALAIGVPLLMGAVTLGLLFMIFRFAKKGNAADLALLHPVGRRLTRKIHLRVGNLGIKC